MQIGTVSLLQSRFHLSLLPSVILRQWLGVSDDASVVAGCGDLGGAPNADTTFEFYLSWLYPSILFFIVLVPFSIIAFFVAALLLLDRLFAVTLAYLFFIAMLTTWTMLRWKYEAWRMSAKVKIMMAFVGAMIVAFEV